MGETLEDGYVSSEWRIVRTPTVDDWINKSSTKEQKKRFFKKIDDLVKDSYIVYLDENIVNHTDWIYLNMSHPDAVKSKFIIEINNFFSFIEKKYNKKVIIAGYPKFSELHNENIYNRRIYYGITSKLVKNSYGVLMHHSTSGHFVALYKKPVIFLTSKNFGFMYNRSIKDFAHVLGANCVDLADKKNYKKFSMVELEKYNKFVKRYINSRNRYINNKIDTRMSDQIIYDELKKLTYFN